MMIFHTVNSPTFPWQFSSPYLGPPPSSQLSSALPLPSLFPFVRSVRVFRRHVEVRHSESPLVSLTLQHRSRVDVVMRFDPSDLRDFDGRLTRDASSNQFLRLTLRGARGTIYGTVSAQSTTFSTYLH